MKLSAKILDTISRTEFHNFTSSDWSAFSGCESENPRIGEAKLNGVVGIIILDGDQISFIDEKGNSTDFSVGTTVWDGVKFMFWVAIRLKSALM